jgi:hypothetical protein
MDAKKTGELAILLFLPIVVLAASGCTNLGLGGSSGVSGAGVVVTKFESSLQSIQSDDEVMLHLEVQNMGDAIAMAAAELINIYPQDWNVLNTEQTIGELLPSDEEAGTEGQLGTLYWRLRAPDLQRGERRTYEPMVRVFYSYETRVIKPITFLTSEELRRAIQNGESLPSEAAIVSAGPLSVNVQAGEFVRTKDDWEQSYFPVEITIENTGGGLIAGENYPIGVEIVNPPGTIFRGDCPRVSQTEWMSFDTSILPAGLTRPISPKWVYMWDGKETKITCELKVVNPPEYRESRELKVVLKYIYYQDAKLPITVEGTREWGF